jgi:hypothetical protein
MNDQIWPKTWAMCGGIVPIELIDFGPFSITDTFYPVYNALVPINGLERLFEEMLELRV